MKLLVACEFSGAVRDAFLRLGHDAWSCDIVPSDAPGPHLMCDVMTVLDRGWDMMIAFPPCTHLCASGARWWDTKQTVQRQAIWFFLALANADIPRICVENPVGIMSKKWRKPDQIINPFQFGHQEAKKTCLWLKNLPKLVPTQVVEPVWRWTMKDGRRSSPLHFLSPSPDRARLRSKTFSGVASAMAEQWGKLKAK